MLLFEASQGMAQYVKSEAISYRSLFSFIFRSKERNVGNEWNTAAATVPRPGADRLSDLSI